MFTEPIIIATRLDWFNMGQGLGSNKTGALIAMLILSSWLFAFLKNKRFIWMSIASSAVLSYFLLLTQSRGALLGLIAGFIAIFTFGRMKHSISSAISLLIIGAAILSYALISGKADRYLQGSEDGSIQARFNLWNAGVHMLTDAPGGWGLGNSGNAYMQWYQPIKNHEEYLSLVNSHLSRLVELPWLYRIAYIFLIAVFLALLFPNHGNAFLSIGFSICICFLIGGIFNPIDNHWALWVIPVIFLLIAINYRYKKKEWNIKYPFCCFLILAGISLSGLHAFSYYNDNDEISISGGTKSVNIGDGPASFTIYKPDQNILGTYYGRIIRKNLSKSGPAEVIYDNSITCSSTHLVLNGKSLNFPKTWKPKKLTFINPDSEALMALLSQRELKNITIYAGRFINWEKIEELKEISYGNNNTILIINPLVAEYYKDWIEILL